MEKKQSKLSFTISRFSKFLRLFLKNGKSAVGVFIIIFFIGIAILAPLITAFNSLGEDPNVVGSLAGKRAAPAWLQTAPTWLGGNPTLSENLQAVAEPSMMRLVSEGGVWNIIMLTENASDYLTAAYNPTVSYPGTNRGFEFSNKPGSMSVTFTRNTVGSTGKVTVFLWTEFDYPYLGAPARLMGNINLLTNGTTVPLKSPTEEWYLIEVASQKIKGNFQNVTGNLSIKVDTTDGIYIAASNITFRDWMNENPAASRPELRPPVGYEAKNWWDWLNGTSLTPSHWNEMKWIVSEGSLVNKTYAEIRDAANPPMFDDTGDIYPYYCFANDTRICDPYLDVVGNTPDIYPTVSWIVHNTTLTAAASVNATKIFVNSTSIFDPRDLITIGWSGANETATVNEIWENYLILDRKLQSDHSEGEPVVIMYKRLKLYDNITWKGRFYVLLKVVVTKPEVYKIKMTVPANCSLNIYSLNQGLYRFPYGKKAEVPSKINSALDINPRTKFMIVDGTAGSVLKVPLSVKVLFEPVSYTHEDLNMLYPPAYVYAKSAPPRGFYVDWYGDLGIKGEIYIVDAFPGSKDVGYWIISRTSVDSQISSYNIEDPQTIANMLTEKPSRYLYGLEISFFDTLQQFSGQNVSTTVYIDDFALKLYGTAYGLMGTDQYGRDLFAQLVYGTRISLYIGILVAVLSVAIGLIVGLAAGYLGGAADQFLMRFNDLLLVLPGLPLLIVLVAVLGTRIENLILLLGLLGWNGFARLVRSQVLSLRERPFVEAAKAAGAGTGHILLRHILPSIMSLVYISLATSVPGAITAEAALAWLGFYDPNRMSWGRMLHEVFAAGATRNWWWILPPGLCIAAIAVAFILLGYALDEILNPKLRIRR